MQKYVLVQFLNPVEDGFEFNMADWPLHVTLTPRVVVDLESTKLQVKLADFLANQKSLRATAGDDEYFGKTLVTVLDPNLDLKKLHKDIVTIFEEAGATFDEPSYMNDGYRAHATVQKSGRVQKGNQIKIDALTLVDMFPNEDINRRKVMKTYALSKD